MKKDKGREEGIERGMGWFGNGHSLRGSSGAVENRAQLVVNQSTNH